MSAERLQAARELHGAGQIEEALAAYSALLAEREDDAELWHLRAIAEHQLGRAELARTSAGRAIAVVNFMIANGVQPQHLVAAGFGEFLAREHERWSKAVKASGVSAEPTRPFAS